MPIIDSSVPVRARPQAGRRWAHRAACGLAAAGATLAFAASAEAAGSGGAGAPSAAAKASSLPRGAGVAALQRALGVPADGVYGPQTRRAVRRFQRANGLTVDGIAGPQTLKALGLSPTALESARPAGVSAVLRKIAACESGGDPSAVSPDGRYRGKYQFSRATWRAMGGTGDPAEAPEAVQDRLAAKLYARSGPAPWPNCA